MLHHSKSDRTEEVLSLFEDDPIKIMINRINGYPAEEEKDFHPLAEFSTEYIESYLKERHKRTLKKEILNSEPGTAEHEIALDRGLDYGDGCITINEKIKKTRIWRYSLHLGPLASAAGASFFICSILHLSAVKCLFFIPISILIGWFASRLLIRLLPNFLDLSGVHEYELGTKKPPLRFFVIFFSIFLLACIILSMFWVGRNYEDRPLSYEDGYEHGLEDAGHAFEDAYEQGFEDARHAFFEENIEIALDDAYYFTAQKGYWHPEEAIRIIDIYNNPNKYPNEELPTQEEFSEAIESLCIFYEYFYGENYKDYYN